MQKVPVVTCFRGGPHRPKGSKILKLCYAMLALFFAIGRSWDAFCASGCACRCSWSVFVRLGRLRARFWRGLGRSGDGFGGPRGAFLKAFVHEKTSKNAALGPPKPSPERPKPIQNRARSGPRRTKTNQERRQAQPDAQKAPQKRPRAKNSANMSPNEVRKLRIEVHGAPP